MAYVLTAYTEVIYADEKSATRTFVMDQVGERQSKIKLTTGRLYVHVPTSEFPQPRAPQRSPCGVEKRPALPLPLV